jgi:tryptophan 2,3-dioxygenase
MNEKVLLEKLRRLEEKYAASGQNLESYLDGLYEADFLNYWDYIHLDTLLSLQVKRSTLPDEEVFIVFHQITELYFKLIIHELEQLCLASPPDAELLENKLCRIIRYLNILVKSFTVMSEGLDQGQFMRFRLALVPASGFQSVQFRKIELMSTSIKQLLDAGIREKHHALSPEEKTEGLYWRSGSTDLASGRKTLTLSRFEEKYNPLIRQWAEIFQDTNLNAHLEKNIWGNPIPEQLKDLLRQFDQLINISWRSAHLQSAGRYLKSNAGVTEATGGTNWQRYLPPGFQKIVFFPSLWSEEEQQNWGHQILHRNPNDFTG